MTTTQKLHAAAREFIKESWKKRSQVEIPGIVKAHGPQYPASISIHVEMSWGTRKKIFRVEVRDITESCRKFVQANPQYKRPLIVKPKPKTRKEQKCRST